MKLLLFYFLSLPSASCPFLENVSQSNTLSQSLRLYVVSTSSTFHLLRCNSSMGSGTQMKYCPPFGLMSVLHMAIFFFPFPCFITSFQIHKNWSSKPAARHVFFFWTQYMQMRVGCLARMTDVFEAWKTEFPALIPPWPPLLVWPWESRLIILRFIFLIWQMRRVN